MSEPAKPPRRYLIPMPRTPAILAYGVLIGCFFSDDMDWKTAMLMILTYYFTKEQQRATP